MKEIKAIIQPFMLADVLHALERVEAPPGVSVSQIAGWGKTRSRNAEDISIEPGHRMARKTRVEVVLPDDLAETVVAAIATAARTGRVRDGKILVSAVEDTVQIRTSERGAGAV